MTETLSNFATTVQKHVNNATSIQPSIETEPAIAECCVSRGCVLIKNAACDSAIVTHISNVVMELPLNA